MKNAIDFETTQGKSSGAGHQSRIARDRQPKTTSGYQKPRSSGSSKYFEDDTGTRGSQDTISTDFIVVSKTTRAVSSARFLFLFFFFFSSTDGSKWDYSLWTIEANNSKLEYSTGFLQRQVRHSGASDQSGAGKLDQTCCFLSLLKIVSKVTLVERGSLSLIYASPVHFFGAGGGPLRFSEIHQGVWLADQWDTAFAAACFAVGPVYANFCGRPAVARHANGRPWRWGRCFVDAGYAAIGRRWRLSGRRGCDVSGHVHRRRPAGRAPSVADRLRTRADAL